MMICPDCGSVIIGSLGCRPCLEKRSWAGAWKQLPAHVPDILRDCFLTVKRSKKHHIRHVQLPNHFGSFCGADLRDVKGQVHWEKETCRLSEIRQLRETCPQCLSVIEKAITTEAAR